MRNLVSYLAKDPRKSKGILTATLIMCGHTGLNAIDEKSINST